MNKQNRKRKLVIASFIAIPTILYLAFIIYPTAYSVWISFFDWNAFSKEKTFTGLSNYVTTILDNKIFRVALVNNLKWCLGSILLPMLTGLLLAVFISKGHRGSEFLQTAIFIPVVLSVTAVGLIWRWMYDPSFGLITNLISDLTAGKAQFNWYSEPSKVIYYLIVAGSWAYTGMCMCLFVTGIKGIPKDTINAAKIDGATSWQVFISIILPQLKNTINAVLIYTLANSFKVFDLVFVMTGGGPGRLTNVLASLSYETVFTYHEYGQGSAIAVLMTLILLAISIVINKIIKIGRE